VADQGAPLTDTDTFLYCPSAVGVHTLGVTTTDAAGPVGVGPTYAAWVTVNVVAAVPAVNVTTPVRAAPVFAVTVTVGVAPFTPVVGLIESHDWFEDADQEA